MSNATKILIVDDDVTSLDLVDLMFEQLGFEVVRLADGAAVLEQVDEINPKLLILDLMMPRVSGVECIKRLRQRGFATPIIAFTAMHDPDIHSETIAAGANLLLQKPCSRQKLVSSVQSLLEKC